MNEHDPRDTHPPTGNDAAATGETGAAAAGNPPAGPQATGPEATGSQATGSHAAGPQATGPESTPHGTEPHGTEPHGTQQTRGVTEEFKVSGEAVVAKVKELVREGNVRRITIKNEEGRTLIEVPLTLGVIGTVLLPVWAAIGAIAALAANLTIAVERRIDTPADPSAPGHAPQEGDHA